MADKKQDLAQIEQAIEQLSQQLQQITQESQQNDQQTFQVIDEITSTIEQLNKQILQLKEEYDMIEKERQEQEKTDQIKKESYNKGFTDAESMYMTSEDAENPQGLEGIPNLEEQGLPEDILSGIEDMSDDELALLLESNPELVDLIQ